MDSGSRQRLTEAYAAETEPDARLAELRRRVDSLATRCADAEAEFDAAVDAGFPMPVLVLRDQEFAAASRGHRDALRDLQRATHAPARGGLTVAVRH